MPDELEDYLLQEYLFHQRNKIRQGQHTVNLEMTDIMQDINSCFNKEKKNP